MTVVGARSDDVPVSTETATHIKECHAELVRTGVCGPPASKRGKRRNSVTANTRAGDLVKDLLVLQVSWVKTDKARKI